MAKTSWSYRPWLLVFDCALTFGCYFNIDLPSALQTDIQLPEVECTNFSRNASSGNDSCCSGCLGLGPDRYNQLYFALSWANAIFAAPFGIIVDRIGSRISAIIVTTLTSFGVALFATSTITGIAGSDAMFPIMMIGRSLLGAGTSGTLIVQDRMVMFWFQDHLSTAYGFVIMSIRLGNVSNFLLTANVARWLNLKWAFVVGLGACLISLVSAILLAVCDYMGTKQLDSDSNITLKGPPLKIRDLKKFPLSYWMSTLMIMTLYASYLPFVANGSKYIQDRYGYSKSMSSYFNGAVYDVSVLFSPLIGWLLSKFKAHGVAMIMTSLFLIPVFPLLSFGPALHPLVFTIWIGLAYTIAAICMWPCVMYVVPDNAIGSAIGFATFVQGIGIGAVNLAVGKILDSEEDNDLISDIHHYRVVLWLLFAMAVCCLLSTLAANYCDLKGGRKLNTRFYKKKAKLMKIFADDKSSLLPDGPSIQSYASISDYVGT